MSFLKYTIALPVGMAQSNLRLNISNALNRPNSGYAALD